MVPGTGKGFGYCGVYIGAIHRVGVADAFDGGGPALFGLEMVVHYNGGDRDGVGDGLVPGV